MPVVDLVCINPAHNINLGSRLWQVKASCNDLYFNKTNSYITIGSKRWGYSIHQNFEDKNFLIGYICLKVEDNNTNFSILKEKSFALYPNLELEDKEPYYEYLEEGYKNAFLKNKNKNVIRWNNCIVLDVDLIDVTNEVSKSETHTKVDYGELNKYTRQPDIIPSDLYYLYSERTQYDRDAKRRKYQHTKGTKLFTGSGGSYNYKIKYTYQY